MASLDEVIRATQKAREVAKARLKNNPEEVRRSQEKYKGIPMDPEAAQELIDRLQTPGNRSAAGPDENTAPRPKIPADQRTGTKQSSITSHGGPVSQNHTAGPEAPSNQGPRVGQEGAVSRHVLNPARSSPRASSPAPAGQGILHQARLNSRGSSPKPATQIANRQGGDQNQNTRAEQEIVKNQLGALEAKMRQIATLFSKPEDVMRVVQMLRDAKVEVGQLEPVS
ncbi:hypothetical protein EPUS_08349 [Endocarpon pusillum Z07020]|uniref:Uncharacterized protein n=1 Tax=Endocarpon pusillum (strain Z07020 / HMAS-L-300199) TaxID=1263415 RepID=U1GG91_ENDPU|nr:uncharacterized protein EPUS_08349 [Endocarpon pusillum Z07020]ERF70791.1 hypothetical protein EPUS_08349 [Endocarpon pusillum Z07020]